MHRKFGGSFPVKIQPAHQAPAGQFREVLNPGKLAPEALVALTDELARSPVVIATEVGGGVVPIDPEERARREAAGRLACLLAERADAVIRVFCGIPRALKGELL